MHPTQNQVTDTVTPQRVPGVPATADTTGAADAVRTVLLDAANYLSAHGWNQYSLYADTHTANPVACTVGALSMVCYGYPAEGPTYNTTHPAFDVFDAARFHLDCYVTETFGPETGGVFGFNDRAGRTVAEVLALLRNAASWVPGPAWASVPRCNCGDRMLLNGDRPFAVSSEDPWDGASVTRIFTCRVCASTRYVDVTDPDDRVMVRMAFLAWVCQQPHDGNPPVAGCTDDCDTCDRFCDCDLAPCVLHDEDDGESPPSWHVAGDPVFGAVEGLALGGAE